MWLSLLVIILTPIFTLLWVSFEADVDDNHFERRQYFKNHTDRFLARMFSVLMLSCVDLIWGIFATFCFWAFFDLMLNLRRSDQGIKWNYIGSESESDNWAINNKNMYFATKIISVILCILCIIYKIKYELY